MKTLQEVMFKNRYQLREHTGLLKTQHNYDIYDFETNTLAFECREEMPTSLNTALQLTRFSLSIPFHIHITASSGQKITSVRRHPDFFHNNISVLDADGEMLWIIHENNPPNYWLEISDNFGEKMGKVVAKGANYTLFIDDQMVSQVSKTDTKRELFDFSGCYTLGLATDLGQESPLSLLTFAVALCADLLQYD
ncbi:MAG: hypothetical protein H7Y04_05715 [Verrucomicrobia bacterium]|nr:hypothetical protein [Cytophagales bacterium]